jgi:hypothetical protein
MLPRCPSIDSPDFQAGGFQHKALEPSLWSKFLSIWLRERLVELARVRHPLRLISVRLVTSFQGWSEAGYSARSLRCCCRQSLPLRSQAI